MKTLKQTILIMTDTQGFDMVGCYDGGMSAITPCIDKLAAEGVRFEYAYSCQPVCGPARSAIFTGTYPHTNGSWANALPVGDSIKSIGQRLSDQGIASGYVGKWHLDAGDYFGDGICPEGWDPDYWYDMRCYLDELSEADRKRSRTVCTAPAEFTFAHRCTERAKAFVEAHKDRDFFLVVSYDEPHHPYVCPPEYMEMHEGLKVPLKGNHADALDTKPEHHRVWSGDQEACDGEDLSRICRQAQAYQACNSFVDHEIGRVVDAIDEGCPDAMIIYTSDHGDAQGAHRISNKGPCMYDEVARVPYIYRCHGKFPAGSVVTEPGSHIDIVPTVLDFMEQEAVPALEGTSVLPTLFNPLVQTNEYAFSEFHRYEVDHDGFGGFQPLRAIFDGHYKLVINLLTSDELYDMECDPGEMENLILSEEHIAIRNHLHDRLLDWMNETRDPFRGYYWERRPWREDAREASWDYTGMTRQRLPDGYHPEQRDYNDGLTIMEYSRAK